MLVGGEERLSHTAPRVSPLLRCAGPIMKSSFLSRRNITGPLPRSSLCPPGPVSGTAAVSGAGGLGAGERPTCSGCSLLPSPSPASRPSLLAAHTSIHVFSPFAQVLWEHRERETHGRLLTAGPRIMASAGAVWSLLLSHETCATRASPPHPSSHFPCHGGWLKNGGGVVQGSLTLRVWQGPPEPLALITSEDTTDTHRLPLAVFCPS